MEPHFEHAGRNGQNCGTAENVRGIGARSLPPLRYHVANEPTLAADQAINAPPTSRPLAAAGPSSSSRQAASRWRVSRPPAPARGISRCEPARRQRAMKLGSSAGDLLVAATPRRIAADGTFSQRAVSHCDPRSQALFPEQNARQSVDYGLSRIGGCPGTRAEAELHPGDRCRRPSREASATGGTRFPHAVSGTSPGRFGLLPVPFSGTQSQPLSRSTKL